MKALRISLYLTAATLLLVLALAGSLWFWSGVGTSLATSLGQLARWLPAGQTLEAKEVTGSLRGGGSIGWLRWQQGELSVEVREVTIAWSLRPLLDGELKLGPVAAKHVRIEDRRAPSEPGAATPPVDLRLPLRVSVPFSVDTVEWVGSTSLQATGLSGNYVFDSIKHSLDEGQVHISSGDYRMSASVEARAPMALSIQVDGTVHTTVPGSTQALKVQAHATVKGVLAGRDAALALQAKLVPELQSTATPAAKAQAMQASLTARVQPWQAQPLAEAQASWQALDLAALWPQAPRTRLGGTAHVTPAGPGWQAGAQLTNTLSGPWDQQRLPLESLETQIEFLAGQWQVQSLRATGAGGRIEGTGQFNATPTANATANAVNTPTPAQWQGSANIYGINTAALDSRLATAWLDGRLTAEQTPTGIGFEARLQPAKGKTNATKTNTSTARTLEGLRLKTLHAQGLWNAPTLKLSTLAVQTDDAQLQGQLAYQTLTQATEGQLALTLPGATAALAGHMASNKGAGELSLRVLDAALVSRWIARLPGAPTAMLQTLIQGNAEVNGRWQGGWQNQGEALQIQASLRAPRLELRQAGQAAEQAWRLREGQVDLTGTLRAMTLSAQGQAETGSQRLNLQAQAKGGRLREGVWQAQLDSAQLTAQDRLKAGTWTAQLRDRATFNWAQTGTRRTLQTSAGALRLSGPVPGAALVTWEPVHWSEQTTAGKARAQWRTQGRIVDLPLAWLDLLGQTQMANLGLRGDLIFGGQWDASSAETLRLRATLERTGGDLQLQAEGDSAGGLQAGVREARLLITAEGEQLAASLHWDSERAGQAQANVTTRLTRQDGNWAWPMEAPLAGTIKAQLPPVGVWSVLAPPGWRLRGTLNADAVLSGTRGAPQWHGNLAAQDLAVRSVVDGIDFSKGTLRATLGGQRLDINEFTLQGAGGASGGLLTIKGSMVWLPAAGSDDSAVQRLRMELEATAQALRVSARADRRLVLSGQLSAQLKDANLAIRGTLKADQALFILPEDSTPQLGSDVLVRKPQSSEASSQPPALAPKSGAKTRVTPDLAITLDLGRDFQVRGRGVNTRLAGGLELRSSGPNPVPSLTGAVRTVRGTYKAYGQQLNIERGVVRFVGPYDNPALDVLAIRPNLQQRVGVQILGTALSPVVRLYAEPDLPEAEKLAWLVLGRSGASGGAETAMLQQAAMALLGGNGISGGLAASLGLDELSVGANSVDGTTSATITLGKRLSRDFYIAYERSLAGTMGTLSIFYDLSRRFTLRAQTGEQSAIDLIFTLRYD